MRTPISRVRSVTLTSMMFITPIPPTSREMAAIEPSRIVSVFCVSVAVSMQRGHVADLEVRLAVAAGQRLGHGRLGLVDACDVVRGHRDVAEEPLPEQPQAARGVRHEDDVVLVLARRGRAPARS